MWHTACTQQRWWRHRAAAASFSARVQSQCGGRRRWASRRCAAWPWPRSCWRCSHPTTGAATRMQRRWRRSCPSPRKTSGVSASPSLLQVKAAGCPIGCFKRSRWRQRKPQIKLNAAIQNYPGDDRKELYFIKRGILKTKTISIKQEIEYLNSVYDCYKSFNMFNLQFSNLFSSFCLIDLHWLRNLMNFFHILLSSVTIWT